jgi:hypothetical protein
MMQLNINHIFEEHQTTANQNPTVSGNRMVASGGDQQQI